MVRVQWGQLLSHVRFHLAHAFNLFWILSIERLKARNIDFDSGIHTLVFKDPETPQSMCFHRRYCY